MEGEKLDRQDSESIYQLFPPSPTPTPPGSSMLSGILFHCLQFCLFETPLGFSSLTVNLLLIAFCSAPKGQGAEWGQGIWELEALHPEGPQLPQHRLLRKS